MGRTKKDEINSLIGEMSIKEQALRCGQLKYEHDLKNGLGEAMKRDLTQQDVDNKKTGLPKILLNLKRIFN